MMQNQNYNHNSDQKQHENAKTLQSVIKDSLFPELEHVSDLKQILEIAKEFAQNISQEQIRALILLQELGGNKYLHGDKNPYTSLINQIQNSFKKGVANPNYYLDLIEELIPKPPKPVIFAPNGKQVSGGGR